MAVEAIAKQHFDQKYSQGEWETRIELAALYRVMHHYGMTDIVNQEVGARVKGEPDCFLIHPYGWLFEELCASDFVKIKLDGTVMDGPGIWQGSGSDDFVAHSDERWVSDGGVNLGKWIFSARPDINFFIHAHCEDVMAVSATDAGLLPVSQAAIYLGDMLEYLDYDFQEDDDYAELFKRTIQHKDIIMSHNHGYYALGTRASAVFFRSYYLRQGCEVQVKAAATAAGTGKSLHLIDPQRVAMIQDQMRDSPNYHYDGTTEWAALLRKLNRECPEYQN